MAQAYSLEKLETLNIKEKAYDYGITKPDIPAFINNNLKHDFFDWQKEAVENLLTFEALKEKENKNTPTHLMFNMATGSGKTLLMAAVILYYYKKGYHHFLFFVNRNNIVDKTENNFLDATHSKYLFKDKIIFDEKIVQIKNVSTFSQYTQDIEIKFTTMQKFYNDIHLPKENQTTLEDLQQFDIVLLADEAHHLNANTKNIAFQKQLFNKELRGSMAEKEKEGWEHTIIEYVLKKYDFEKREYAKNNKNILLEFTATIPENEKVAQKYQDKIIYKFGLKEFLQAGYTKEINLISSTLGKKERVLQALLFSWYRHKIALKYNIPNFKAVVLFRSKTIEESKKDHEEFLNQMAEISGEDFHFLKTISQKIFSSTDNKQLPIFEMGKSRTEIILTFIQEQEISYNEIAQWLKQNFSAKNILITNSKTNKNQKEKTDAETEKLLNSLEHKDNHIRAIFTVDRLTEGWDVLNLFDIVRLYQGQNTGGSSKKTPDATTKEKQLIGRGVRYFPFEYKDRLKNKRKFDDDLNHELRILEELYYYTYDEESRYISHLKAELRKDGYISDNKFVKTFSLKKDFQKNPFYNNVNILYNEQINNPNRKKKNLEFIRKDFFPTWKIKGFEFQEQEIDFEHEKDSERIKIKEKNWQTIEKKIKDIEKHIFFKAINMKAQEENSLFRFENLKKELTIESINDLQTDKLADFVIRIVVAKNISYENIDNSEKLSMIIKFLDSLFTELKKEITPKIGSNFKMGNFKKFFSESKTRTITENPNIQDFENDLKNESWYVLDSFYGTSEEKALINFIKESMANLENKYTNIYLLRNEEMYKIYDFEKGRGFQPDFILFLKDKKNSNSSKQPLYYQIFIEPKGEQFLDAENSFEQSKEGWKENFLQEITARYGFKKILTNENQNYRLIGLPFFNSKHNEEFEQQYKTITNNT